MQLAQATKNCRQRRTAQRVLTPLAKRAAATDTTGAARRCRRTAPTAPQSPDPQCLAAPTAPPSAAASAVHAASTAPCSATRAFTAAMTRMSPRRSKATSPSATTTASAAGKSYLGRSDDFVRFCCHMHICEMLSARGGSRKTRGRVALA